MPCGQWPDPTTYAMLGAIGGEEGGGAAPQRHSFHSGPHVTPAVSAVASPFQKTASPLPFQLRMMKQPCGKAMKGGVKRMIVSCERWYAASSQSARVSAHPHVPATPSKVDHVSIGR